MLAVTTLKKMSNEIFLERAKTGVPLLSPADIKHFVQEYEVQKRLWDPIFAGIERFVVFLGYPRSSHSLVGSLIDAHPDAMIAHELHLMALVKTGKFTKNQLCYLLCKNSEVSAGTGRRWVNYSYAVPNQWQGRFRNLRVLGDKRGGGTTRLLTSDPEIFDKFRNTFGDYPFLLHVVRNPFDNISTISVKNTAGIPPGISGAIQFYFGLNDSIAKLRETYPPDRILTLYSDDMNENPRGELEKIFEYLGLPTTEDLMKDCTSIINPTPSRTRENQNWTESDIADIKRRTEKYSFLQRYL